MDTDIDWGKLPFGYYPTDYNVRCTFRDGKWGAVEVSQSETVNLHIAATCLHYSQEIFEGLKASSACAITPRVSRTQPVVSSWNPFPPSFSRRCVSRQ